MLDGWWAVTEVRKEGRTAGTTDTHFHSPEGRRFRSRADVDYARPDHLHEARKQIESVRRDAVACRVCDQLRAQSRPLLNQTGGGQGALDRVAQLVEGEVRRVLEHEKQLLAHGTDRVRQALGAVRRSDERQHAVDRAESLREPGLSAKRVRLGNDDPLDAAEPDQVGTPHCEQAHVHRRRLRTAQSAQTSRSLTVDRQGQ